MHTSSIIFSSRPKIADMAPPGAIDISLALSVTIFIPSISFKDSEQTNAVYSPNEWPVNLILVKLGFCSTNLT